MDRYRRVITPFVVLIVLFGVLLKIGRRYHRWVTEITLDTVKPDYYHYEFIDIRLRSHSPELFAAQVASPLRAEILREGQPVTTIAGLRDVDLIWNDAQGAFIGHWPCPWNAPAGEYQVALIGPADLQQRLKTRPFRIVRRVPKPLPRHFVALTLESIQPFATMRVRTPDGNVTGWKGLLDWVQFVGADALWLLAGQTRPEKPDGGIWVSYNLPMMSLIAKECHRRGIKFGAYAMCYLTMSKVRLSRYQYAEDIDQGKPVFTRAISLDDPQRPKDVAELLKRLRADGADYVGLDYIRNALGGYELIEDFFKEMTWIPRPDNWAKLSRDERILWFARKKIARKDKNFVDAWQWWRAHHVAGIVRQIRRDIGDDVSLWAFTLSWDKGWQHGQDPVIMNDAGVDADAIMMYEATPDQFEAMTDDWHRYVRRGDVQLMPGDVLDWPLHQRSPKGPGEFVYRMKRAINGIYGDGSASGIFIHDLARGLWGRLGPYSTLDWMNAAKSVVSYFRSLPGGFPPSPELEKKRMFQPVPAPVSR